MTASGCVWSTCGSRDERVQQRLDRRARLVGSERRAAQVVDHRRVVHRLARRAAARCSSSRRAAKPAAVIVARSVPEPLTQSTRVSRPAWSTAVPFDGRVAAALVRERPVGAEQVRAVDERVERSSALRRLRRPTGPPARESRRALLRRSCAHLECRQGDGLREALPRLAPAAVLLRFVDRRCERCAHDLAPFVERSRARRAPSPGRGGCRAASPPRGRRGREGRRRSPSSGRAARCAHRRRRRGSHPAPCR